jgi:transposase
MDLVRAPRHSSGSRAYVSRPSGQTPSTCCCRLQPRAFHVIQRTSATPTQRGRPRRRPHKLHADKGYDDRHLRLALRKRRIIPRIARCGVEPKNRLGRDRWVVERTLSWLNRFRRLKIRAEHRADIQLAFVQLGCALISLRFLGEPRPTRENGRPGPPRTASAILGT